MALLPPEAVHTNLDSELAPEDLGVPEGMVLVASDEPADAEEPEGPVAEPADVAPPPPPPAAGKAPAGRVRSDLFLHVPGGKLTFYAKGFFTASCEAPGHSKCILSRSSEAGRKRAQGRPLGLLMAWLAAGAEHPTKEGHWDRTQWPNFQQRRDAREALAILPLGQELLAQERAQEPGEDIEPDDLA